MKPRFALSTKIFLLAFYNLLLLALVFLLFARFQLHMQVDSFLLGAQDRVVSMARQLTLDLEETPVELRDELLARYKRMYRVQFYLYARLGGQLAGPPVNLPAAVFEELRKPSARNRGSAPPDPLPSERRREHGGEHPVFEVSTTAPTAYWVGVRIPIRALGEDEQRPGTLLMSAPYFLGTPLFFDYKPWLAVSGVILLVFVLCWLPFIRGLTRAVTQMSQVTEKIAEGSFDHHIVATRRDELGVLAVGINSMASRLSGFVYGQKRFLGDIAHELCAPIARTQFALGILEQRTEPGTVDDLQEEVRQMSSLVAELLSFSKTGMQRETRPLANVDVASVVAQAVAREGARVEIKVEYGLRAMADSESLSRAIANLVRNATRYGGEAGPVVLTARRDAGQAVIRVADNGPGLPANEVDRVFTPFYRVESSRNRVTGGVGLGLAIVKNCMEACKGTVRCRNRVPSGLEVEIRLAAV